MTNFLSSISVYFNAEGAVVFSNVATSGDWKKAEKAGALELRKAIVKLAEEFNKKLAEEVGDESAETAQEKVYEEIKAVEKAVEAYRGKGQEG